MAAWLLVLELAVPKSRWYFFTVCSHLEQVLAKIELDSTCNVKLLDAAAETSTDQIVRSIDSNSRQWCLSRHDLA